MSANLQAALVDCMGANVGTGQAISIRELSDNIGAIHREVSVNIPSPGDEAITADIELLPEFYGWNAGWSLEEGLC